MKIEWSDDCMNSSAPSSLGRTRLPKPKDWAPPCFSICEVIISRICSFSSMFFIISSTPSAVTSSDMRNSSGMCVRTNRSSRRNSSLVMNFFIG